MCFLSRAVSEHQLHAHLADIAALDQDLLSLSHLLYAWMSGQREMCSEARWASVGATLPWARLAARGEWERPPGHMILRFPPVSSCLPQRRKNVHGHREVLHTPRVRRKSRERLEPSMAFRAMPEMADTFPIQILRALRCNQFVVATDTTHSE
jgi:hypothetical protein